MEISTVNYLGNLSTECTHKSGSKIITDAPIDNFGKGAAFSPTDLMATSLASCFITIVGIYCQQHNLPFEHCSAKVEKIMSSAPRKIARINIKFDFLGNNWDDITLKKAIAAGKTCPVHLTLEDNVEIFYIFS
jgi:uncharacterized OsmC-like protein